MQKSARECHKVVAVNNQTFKLRIQTQCLWQCFDLIIADVESLKKSQINAD
jgi:hypothetical protein